MVTARQTLSVLDGVLRRGLVRPVLLLAAALALVAVLYAVQARQAVCGDQLEPGPPVFSAAWWSCPIEVNRIRRVVGRIGSAGIDDVVVLDDGLRGWAVGDGGAIVATADGGRTWVRQSSGTGARLFSLAVNADGRRGWAVGEDGSIVSTTDGGGHWQPQPSGVRVQLSGLAMNADGERGWAVGDAGTILATTDAGRSWQPQASGVDERLFGITMLADGLRGWVVGSAGTLLATDDGGRRWTPQASGVGVWLLGIAMHEDGLRGWAAGEDGTVVATTDGGQRWQPRASGVRAMLNGVAIGADGERGWAVGDGGTIVATTDGGRHWAPQASGTGAWLNGLAIHPDGARVWVVGDEGSILATDDGGHTWRAQASRVRAWLSAVSLQPDGRRGWAVGAEGAILATDDGGTRWTPVASGVHAWLNGLHVDADGRRGWAVGGEGAIVATTDGGATWAPRPSGVGAWLNGVAMTPDGQRGWAVGDGGTLVATADGGRSWQPQASGVGVRLFGAALTADGQRAWVVGEQGAIVATADGGRSWRLQPSGVRTLLSSVAFDRDGRRGWAVGDEGAIVATTDGGQTWLPQASGVRALLNGVLFQPDGLRGWAVGVEGSIVATADGGRSWAPQRSGLKSWLTGIGMDADGLRGCVVGSGGAIATTTDGGRSWAVARPPYRRWPAPAYLVAMVLPCFLVLGWAMGHVSGARLRTLTDRIFGHGVADAPVTQADQDRLGFRPVVQALGTFLRHESTHPPLTLAITAPWGRGKSSMMRLLQAQLQRKGLRTVWFNAWHHQKEPVMMAALLATLVAQATPPWLSLQGWRFRTRLVWRRFVRRPFSGALPALLWFGAAVVLPLSLAAALVVPWVVPPAPDAPSPALNPVFAFWADQARGLALRLTGNAAVEALLAGEWSRFARETLGAIGNDPGKVLPLLLTLWLLVSVFLLFTYFCRAFPARPSALLASVGSRFSLAQAEEQTGFRQRFRDHFQDVTQALRPATLTIFIDDLDRCEPAKSAEMLETVNYLADAGECFIVIGMAREIVEAQVGEAFRDLAERTQAFERAREATGLAPEPAGGAAASQLLFARRYLAKLVQLEVPVPSFDPAALGHMIEGLHDDDPPAAGAGEQALRAARLEARLEDRLARAADRLAWAARVVGVGVFVLLVGLQAELWLDQDAARQRSDATVRAQRFRQAEQETAPGRLYAQWLRADVERLRREAAGTAPLELARREADWQRAQAWLAREAQWGDAMRQQLKAGQTGLFDQALGEASLLAKDIAVLVAKDADYDAASRAGRAAAATAAAAASGAASAGSPQAPAPRTRPDDNDLPAGTAAGVVGGVLALLLLPWGVGLVLGRDRERVRETAQYREALKRCQPLLARLPAYQSPREVKRFVNLSRYLAVRLRASIYQRLTRSEAAIRRRAGTPPPQDELGLTEAQIVALTALYIARGVLALPAADDAWLVEPAAAAQQISDPALRRFVQETVDAAGGWPERPLVAAFLGRLAEVRF